MALAGKHTTTLLLTQFIGCQNISKSRESIAGHFLTCLYILFFILVFFFFTLAQIAGCFVPLSLSIRDHYFL